MTEEQPTRYMAQPAIEALDVFASSETFGKIAAALALSQLKYGELKATQTADAEKFKYTYADLASVLAAVRPALAGNGIAIVQGVAMQKTPTGFHVLVETRLIHASGEWLSTTLRLPATDTAPQKVGSLVSYLRRYGLLAMTACAAEDDDGKDAMPAPVPRVLTSELPPARKRAVKPQPEEAAVDAHRGDVQLQRVKTKFERTQPLSSPGTISAADRGLLFKVAKEQGLNERQVKALLFAMFAYTSTSQIHTGPEFAKVISAMESPNDHGVSFDETDAYYDRDADLNALPEGA